MQTKATPKVTGIVVKGVNSEVAEELDLEIIKTVMEWFVSEAPKELRTLHNVGRVIRMNDRLINLIAAETKSSVDYIEKRALERHGLPVDGDRRYSDKDKYDMGFLIGSCAHVPDDESDWHKPMMRGPRGFDD